MAVARGNLKRKLGHDVFDSGKTGDRLLEKWEAHNFRIFIFYGWQYAVMDGLYCNAERIRAGGEKKRANI